MTPPSAGLHQEAAAVVAFCQRSPSLKAASSRALLLLRLICHPPFSDDPAVADTRDCSGCPGADCADTCGLPPDPLRPEWTTRDWAAVALAIVENVKDLGRPELRLLCQRACLNAELTRALFAHPLADAGIVASRYWAALGLTTQTARLARRKECFLSSSPVAHVFCVLQEAPQTRMSADTSSSGISEPAREVIDQLLQSSPAVVEIARCLLDTFELPLSELVPSAEALCSPATPAEGGGTPTHRVPSRFRARAPRRRTPADGA